MPTPTRDHQDLHAAVSQLLAADATADGVVESVLHALRERLALDVVFVAEFTGGQRVFRFVDRAPGALPVEPGTGHDLELSFCQRVVDGRLPELVRDVAALDPGVDLPPMPFRIGAHLGTPVVLGNGRIFGTLCCFSTAPRPDIDTRDLEALHHCARLVAHKLDAAAARGLADPPPGDAQERPAVYRSEVWNLHGSWSLNLGTQRAWLDA
ncbi:MAG: GAF domain-containing protein [Burkholderiales bacterium]|nr:GAF domain-containing protein [Burkholderiales bacterium]